MLNENHIQNIAHLNMISGEPFLDLRIEKSKAYAEKIVFGTPETDDELRDHVQYIVSKHFHLPFHSEMFDKMTLDDLFLELFLINVKQKPTEQAAEDFIRDNLEEAAGMFDEFEEDFAQKKELTEEEKKSIDEDVRKFKEGGFAAVTKKQPKQGETK